MSLKTQVLSLLQRQESLTFAQIVKAVQASEDEVQAALDELEEAGDVESEEEK